MTADTLQAILQTQRRAFLRDGLPSAEIRIERLNRLAGMVLANADAISSALSEDFGTRSAHATRIGDVIGAVEAIRYNRDHVHQWMRPAPVQLPPAMENAGAHAEVWYQPLGVIGAIVPWNGPVLMAVLAAAGALVAGNRLMLKVPELTPRASSLLKHMFTRCFEPNEVHVTEGDARVGAAFSQLRFDHLLFTGSAATARHVAAAAAANLVPVTLELGGRNPAIVGRSADLTVVAARIVTGKMASAGQVCVSPDYVLVPRPQLPALLDAMAKQAALLYPRLLNNDDYTAIVSQGHFSRLKSLLQDALERGAQVREINPSKEALWDNTQRKFPFCLLTEVTPDMRLMQEETFGPILSVLPYDNLELALEMIASQPHPLSAYYFGTNTLEQRQVLQGVTAGNMVINDVRCQLFFEQLPFGGVGPSGNGRYRGHEGFCTFSNAKTVLYQMLADEPLAAQRPPFGAASLAAAKTRVEALRKEFPHLSNPKGDTP